MEGSEGSPPTSLWMIRAAELFPKPTMEREDEKLTVPFLELAGESVKYLGRTDDGVLALSNYRLFLLKTSTNSETSVPLGLIESAQTRDLFHLVISCKDASTVKCSFPTSEQCSEWQRRITLSVGVPENLESLFAFPFYAWVTELGVIDSNEWAGRLQRSGRFELDFRKEVERLQFDVNGTWRISEANVDFKLCPSYPKLLLVPCCISDETLLNVASFRSSRRIPAVVWRHKLSGAVIARCSQPEVGWLGWRNSKDEQLLKALADACAFDRGEQSRRQNLNASGESTPSSAEGSHEEVSLDEVRKVLIVDARSYTSAVTNRARGGGCECAEYYPCAEIQFMSLGNIHAIRKSFHALRQLCASPPDIPNWLGLLERTMWLQHMSGLLAASMTVCHAIERNGRPVLVHCSDGWDRTPQIVATAQLCLDPYYRTVEGFRTLVEREWLSFGHKYADRCGHGPGSDELNERCPVFLQWLDLVYQIHRQFPCSFEFSVAYLIKLAQHSHSCLFGTFLCNTIKERIENSVFDRTFSVWPFLSGPMYRNPLYVPNKEKVLWPAHNVRDLVLWSEVYLGSLGNQNSSDFPPSTNEGNQESMSPMTKTRSYGDLITAGGLQNGLTRRSSDPNMTVDSNLMTPLQYSTENSVIDSSSDRGVSPDLSQSLANVIHDTTEKLQNLTNELNQSDEDAEICKINNIDESKSCDFLTQQKHDTHVDDKNIKIENNLNDFNEYDNINVDNDLLKTESSLLFNNKTTEMDREMEMQMKMKMQLTINNTNKTNQINSIHDDDDNDYLSNENGLNINLNQTENNIAFGRRMDSEDYVDGCLYDADANNMENMMQSIDLRGSVINESPATSFCQSQNHSHGSVDTSTETLVPMEHNNQQQQQQHQQMQLSASDNITGICTADIININNSHNLTKDSLDVSDKTLTNSLCNDLNTEVHSIRSKPQQLQQLQQQQIKNNFNLTAMDESILIQPEHQKLEISNNGKCDSIINSIINTTSSHRRRRTSSINSKNDVISPNKIINGSPSPSATSSRFLIQGARSLPLTPPGAPDRPSVAISCPDGLAHALSEQNIRLQQIVYEHKLREDALQRELHGMRMALLKKTCPHCSNQQIVTDEHGDDVFVKRSNQFVGLCNCDSSCVCPTKWFGEGSYFEDSYPNLATNALDNIENSSTCSWEAVEDRIGPTSTGASSTLPGGSVLWVPDHAVSRCTGCTTEFWLGRRKHHCRSCGQIFCADCSEFWAPLPDERLYTPVRLCGPCYHAVTTRIQQQSRSTITSNVPQTNNINNNTNNNKNQNQKSTIATIHTPPLSSSSSSSSVALIATPVSLHPSSGPGNCTTTAPSSVTPTTATAATTTTSMEACKHAANPAHNDRNHLKATAASN